MDEGIERIEGLDRTYEPGELVTLTAVVKDGYNFNGWNNHTCDELTYRFVMPEESPVYISAETFANARTLSDHITVGWNLVVGPKWMARVKKVVDMAVDNNMYIILNSHHDEALFNIGVATETFEQCKKDAAALWTQIAEEFKDYDDHLMFESYNELHNRELEPDGSDSEAWHDVTRYTPAAMVQLNALNQIFADTVRATGGNNKNRVLVLGSTYQGGRQDYHKEYPSARR